ncbi:MAG: DUF3152 domain-containing protein [Micromonosporaceae bacterium]|nr:DUF3152 domain-containing protein [Micromonosporaceae bacterium]
MATFGASLLALSVVGLVAIGVRPDILERLSGDPVHEWWGGNESWGTGPGMEAPPPGPGDAEGFGWTVATGGTEPVGTGPLYRYRVEVETAIGIDANEVARVVDAVLAHPRGWRNEGVSFQRVDTDAPVEMIIRLATPATVDQLCAPLDTNGQVSCRNGIDVVLNQRRWENGVDAYAGDIESYRILLINHEVGHALGHAEHVPCPGPGQPAPVMMPVYYEGLQGCAPNLWPYSEDGRYIG